MCQVPCWGWCRKREPGRLPQECFPAPVSPSSEVVKEPALRGNMCPAVDLGIANGGSHDPLHSLCGWNVPEFAHRSTCLQMPAAWACCPLGQHVSGKRPEWDQCSPPDDKQTWNSAIRRAPGNPWVFCAHRWGQASCFCALTSLHGELVTPAMLRNWPN